MTMTIDTESEYGVTASTSELQGERRHGLQGASQQGRTASGPVLLEELVELSFRMRRRGVDLESASGLSGRELDLVALLCELGPTSVKSLVADLQLPRSTMTAIVDRLEERDFLRRHPNPEDRRSVILESMPRAAEALLRYRESMQPLAVQTRVGWLQPIHS